MKAKTLTIGVLAVLVLAVAGLYSTGNLGSLQGRFTTSGSELTIAASSSTPRSDIVVAGTTDVHFSTYQFTTSGEAMEVDKLEILVKGGTTQVSTVAIEYTDNSGTLTRDVSYVVSGKATFSGLSFYIEEADSADLTIYGDVNAIGSGVTSADKVLLVLGKNNFRAVGQDTGTTYRTLTFSAVGEPYQMALYATKPTLALNAGSPSGVAVESSSDTIFSFDITADASGDVDVKDLRINLASDGDFDRAASVSGTLEDADTGATLAGPVNATFTSASAARFSFSDDFTVTATDTTTVNFVVDTTSLLNTTSGVDDPLTVSITYGTISSAGGMVWNDGYADVRWLGYLTSSTLTGNTLLY